MKTFDSQIEEVFAALLPQLEALKIQGVTITLNGSGDEGSVERIVDGNGKTIYVDNKLHEPLSDLACLVVGTEFPGWEDGEGGFGEFVLDLKKGKCVLNWSVRYVESEDYRLVFKIKKNEK